MIGRDPRAALPEAFEIDVRAITDTLEAERPSLAVIRAGLWLTAPLLVELCRLPVTCARNCTSSWQVS